MQEQFSAGQMSLPQATIILKAWLEIVGVFYTHSKTVELDQLSSTLL